MVRFPEENLAASDSYSQNYEILTIHSRKNGLNILYSYSILDAKMDSISGLGQNTSPFTTHPYSKGFIAIFSLLRQFYQTFLFPVNNKFNMYV
jgi:hypothetical protein